VLVSVAAGVAYREGCRRSRPPVPPVRRWAFLAGSVTVLAALCSPVASYADELLSVHMVQHLLLTLVAAPLLVAGRPLAVVGAALDHGRRRQLPRLRRSRLVAVAGHPLVAWLAFAAVGWVAHFSPLYDLALRHGWAHALEHALFLGSALLFWRAVLGAAARWRLSHPLRLLYLALAMPQMTFLALAIYSSRRPLYRHYTELARHRGGSALADQRQAGGLMWIVGDLTLLGGVLVVLRVGGARATGHRPPGAPRGPCRRPPTRRRRGRVGGYG
jgi:cytochrome c oxidase assembly factor CtaG